MGRLARHFTIAARANRLMNQRLHAACLALSQDEWSAPRTGFFPSIAATLNHILIVDWYYVDALEEGGRGASLFADPMPCTTMAALAEAQRAVDARLIAFCERFDEASDSRDADDALLARVVVFDRGARGRPADRIDRTLPHVFMHQHHHRGQVHAMLSATSVVPPQLDEFLMSTDAVFRVDELQAAGMTEADLAPR